MTENVIIIPSRLEATRLPNKPLKKINNKEMILHVYEAAIKTNTGEVYVATPDQKIIDLIKNNDGKAVLTSSNHQTGTDRVYEVFKNQLKCEPDIVVNLQGDMPNIDPKDITNLISYMDKGRCDIGTLASSLSFSAPTWIEYLIKVDSAQNAAKIVAATDKFMESDFVKNNFKDSLFVMINISLIPESIRVLNG